MSVLSVTESTGWRVAKYANTTWTSQTSVYLGLGGHDWKIPFNKRQTSRFCPTTEPSSKDTYENNALLARLMALYVRP